MTKTNLLCNSPVTRRNIGRDGSKKKPRLRGTGPDGRSREAYADGECEAPQL
ncbi:MAG: hypothetical protein LBK07_02270 [Tannerella sp.]|nr:hypothetical protein [Tannerella sp.]